MDPWAQWRRRSASSSGESYSPWLMSQRSVTVTKSAEIWPTGGLISLIRPAADDDGVPRVGKRKNATSRGSSPGWPGPVGHPHCSSHDHELDLCALLDSAPDAGVVRMTHID
ncbi:MAG: hypothetical protein QOI51_1143 [Nocardioidaceae bacterium]|nr:hypothetical protein [Nocardioidaceae bacterium]